MVCSSCKLAVRQDVKARLEDVGYLSCEQTRHLRSDLRWQIRLCSALGSSVSLGGAEANALESGSGCSARLLQHFSGRILFPTYSPAVFGQRTRARHGTRVYNITTRA
jgi:hypothetical protein